MNKRPIDSDPDERHKKRCGEANSFGPAIAEGENTANYAEIGAVADVPFRDTNRDSVLGSAAVRTARLLGLSSGDQDSMSYSVLIHLHDHNNQPIKDLDFVGSWGNDRVDRILRQPLQRDVIKLRPGRSLNTIRPHEITKIPNVRPYRIVSCLIQATGDVMKQRCNKCDNNQGVFELCVKLDDKQCQRYGNCEWNRQACTRKTVRLQWGRKAFWHLIEVATI
jgi:hypothetical protein